MADVGPSATVTGSCITGDGRDEQLKKMKLDARLKLRKWLQDMIDYPYAAQLMDQHDRL